MTLYEYPFHEGIRTMLRLEHLFERLDLLSARDAAVDHHFALATTFEIIDVASRADLKADVLKDLERQRAQLLALRGHPSVDEASLQSVVQRIEVAHAGLNRLQGKAGQSLNGNEWLMSIRSRISIPAGTCSFDLPAYHAWQQKSPARRREDLGAWTSTLAPLSAALRLLLELIRSSGQAQRTLAPGGQYQQSLAQGKTYHLLRVRVDAGEGLVPEISGHRLMVSIRFMQADVEGRLRPTNADTVFELALCS